MTHQMKLPGTCRIHDAKSITEQFFKRIVAWLCRACATRITTLVGRKHPITLLGKRRDLMSPCVPALREAMQHQHRWTINWSGVFNGKRQPVVNDSHTLLPSLRMIRGHIMFLHGMSLHGLESGCEFSSARMSGESGIRLESDWNPLSLKQT